MKLLLRFGVMVFLVGVCGASLFAQKFELYPNAGAIFPTRMDDLNNNKFKSDGVYGLKGGVFIGENAQIEGSVGYLNHFELKNPPNSFNPRFGIVQPTVYGVMYDVDAAYNFGQRQFLNSRISPYFSAGVGGLTAQVRHATSAFITGGGNIMAPDGAVIPNPDRTIVMNDGDTFFTINYGGGVKALNLWGPVGLRADVRGRTIPNFYGRTAHWPEATGGLVFSWGER